MSVIVVDRLSKEYTLGALQGLKQMLRNAGSRLQGQAIEQRPRFKALDDVSFKVERGEVLGIIGHNGAGKSTLLKMLAKISTPTTGSVKVEGRIAPLIEVGAGFVGDFTGRENVYLNGAILGMSRKEIDRKFEEIVEFAEMAKFIDTPVKRYSSGMHVKLAFAVATSVDSEVLIVDEVLAVGDLAFQRKCFDRMQELISREQRTVLLVSHNIRQVERLCTRVIVMDQGRLALDASPQVACNHFYQQSDQRIAQTAAQNRRAGHGSAQTTGELSLLQATLLGADGLPTDTVAYGHSCTVRLNFMAHRPLPNLTFGIGLHTPDMLYVAIDDSALANGPTRSFDTGEFSIEYHMAHITALPGAYAFRLGIATAGSDRVLFYDENLCSLQIESANLSRSRVVGQGFFLLGGRWSDHIPASASEPQTLSGEAQPS